MTKITLITGGNKGLGFETAKALINEGHKVYIGSRMNHVVKLQQKKLVHKVFN